MKLTAAVQFLKNAVKNPAANVLTCYHVREGFIFAHNEYMQAGAPYEGPEGEYNLPAEELNTAIARMKGEPQLGLIDDHIVVKQGRLKSTIQLVTIEPPEMADADCDWLPLPKGFIEKLKLALPFVGESGWTASVRLTDNRIVAINNRSGIDIAFPNFIVGGAKHIATNTVEFLCAADDPTQYACSHNSITFKWPDERWARMQLLASVMPASVDEVLKGAQGETPIAITADWRAAFEDICALSEGDFELHKDGIETKKGAGRAYVEFPEPAITGRSRWNCKVTEPAIKIATHWNPNTYPNASPFAGPGFIGLVMGVRI